jgi:hypothetical protein
MHFQSVPIKSVRIFFIQLIICLYFLNHQSLPSSLFAAYVDLTELSVLSFTL